MSSPGGPHDSARSSEASPAVHPAHAPHDRAVRRLPGAGDVIAGKYAIEKVVGEGGMGIVYQAIHLRLRQRVAVKMLLAEMLAQPEIVTRFEREARAAGQLRSRHVARVMDVDVTPDGLPYMVMEFLEGHDLELELGQRGRLPWSEVVDHVLQACAGMIEAHQLGIIHRDLKPSNLFLALDGEARVLKVLDFGISKVQSEGDAKLTAAEAVMGTAMYMAPEQVRSSQNVDARSDIWSLGVILYELLSGRPPFVGTPTQVAAAIVSEDPPDLRAACDAPDALIAIVKKALRRDPRERFDDARALALALTPLASGSGASRHVVDWLVNGAAAGADSRPSLPQSQQQPLQQVQGADTVMHAVSEARMREGGVGGTEAGWFHRDERVPARRGRWIVLGVVVAVLGLVAIGGGAAMILRKSAVAAGDPAARASSGTGAPKVSAASDPVVAPPVDSGPIPSVSSASAVASTPPKEEPRPSASASAVRPASSSAGGAGGAGGAGPRPHAPAARPPRSGPSPESRPAPAASNPLLL